MYGLPPDLNLDFLCGKTLLQVCIGANELILNFDGSVSITVMSSIGCTIGDATHHKYEDFRQAAGVVVVLLNKKIDSANGGADGTLSIQFHDGGRLEIYDDSKEYESYIITSGNEMFVI